MQLHPLELDERFESFEQWAGWWKAYGPVLGGRVDQIGARILQQGFVEPMTGRRAEPAQLDPSNRNWREGLIVNGLNSRMRAVLGVLAEAIGDRPHGDIRLYAPEAITALALVLRGRYPKFLGSEYGETPEVRAAMYPIPHEDLTRLSLPSDSFDFVVTNEVLEHVPDLDAALREIARVLKPGGWHIGTHPFNFGQATGVVFARIEGGTVVHLREPEYHGNPIEPEKGSLVFEIPGWDILDRARQAGLATAFMRFVASEREGHLSDPLGNFVFCAQK